MKDITRSNFGLLIAYVLPGFTVLLSISYASPALRTWLGSSPVDSPTVGGFLYATLASVGAGMTISTLRWAVVDSIHHAFGVRQPRWNFTRLQKNLAAFDMLVEVHYRYYQFYSNMLVALPVAAIFKWWATGLRIREVLPLSVVSGLFFAASRDTLRKYYARVDSVLKAGRGSERQPRRSDPDDESIDIDD